MLTVKIPKAKSGERTLGIPTVSDRIARYVGQSLVRWATRKYKKLRRHRTRAWEWLLRVIDREPTLLVLWARQRGVFTIGAV